MNRGVGWLPVAKTEEAARDWDIHRAFSALAAVVDGLAVKVVLLNWFRSVVVGLHRESQGDAMMVSRWARKACSEPHPPPPGLNWQTSLDKTSVLSLSRDRASCD